MKRAGLGQGTQRALLLIAVLAAALATAGYLWLNRNRVSTDDAYVNAHVVQVSSQVTGPVLSMTDSTITVQKGDEKWEIAKDKATPVKGGPVKVGSKVTIKYRMTATNIEVK